MDKIIVGSTVINIHSLNEYTVVAVSLTSCIVETSVGGLRTLTYKTFEDNYKILKEEKQELTKEKTTVQKFKEYYLNG